MRFEKWHGIGNDFVIVHEQWLADALSEDGVTLDSDERATIQPDAAIAICHRHFGLGADGVLVLGPSDVADARMRIHNADGSMAEMCGNGIRVAARFLVKHQLVTPGSDGSFAIETSGGIMRPRIEDDDRVCVDMGRITSEGIATIDLGSVDGDLAGVMLEGHVIHVGNPHFAIHRAPVTNDVHRLGRSAEVHHRFPNRTNVEFWEIDDAQAGIIHMRVWERGVGETLACGTGACAAAFAARAAASLGDQITVRLPGGDLGIQFEGDRAYMTGSAHFVMDGIVDPAHVMNGMPASSVAVSR